MGLTGTSISISARESKTCASPVKALIRSCAQKPRDLWRVCPKLVVACGVRPTVMGSAFWGTPWCAKEGTPRAFSVVPLVFHRSIEWAGEEHGSNPSFEPSVAFEKACLSGCGCCANTTTQANPGRLPECSTQQRVPVFGDEIKPGVPEWCGVCGPTLNADRDVDFYFSTRVENVCQPRKSADKVLCAEAKGPLACLSKIGRCVWGAPDSDGQCVLGDSMVCKRGNSTGVFCGATCLPSFDCALCRSQTRQPSGPIPQLVFEVCCDGCEDCVATGNSTYTDENDCSTFGDGIHDIPCKWEKNK